MPETAPAYYDWEMIAEKMDHISRGNADWQSFLHSVGVQPLELYYEDIVADMPGALTQIADFIGVRIDEAVPDTDTFTPQRQKRQAQADWLTRFEAESRHKLAKGMTLPGVSYPDNIAILRHHARRMAKRIKASAGL